MTLAELGVQWRRRQERGAAPDAGFYLEVARRALDLGEPLLACDACAEGLASDKTHAALRHLHALALARSGALESALAAAAGLVQEGHRDEETLGLLARIHKDFWLLAADEAGRAHHLEASHALYAEAYAKSGGYWSGINAATLILIAGDAAAAARLAEAVRAACLERFNAGERNFWLEATLAESALVRGDLEQARSWYVAARAERNDFGSMASARRNAALLLQARGLDRAWLDEVLPRPTILVFSGHMPDPRDAASRFPASAEPFVAERVRALIRESGARIGYGSAASGSDILFHEAMLDAGGESHVVLPGSPERFEAVSVGKEQRWPERYASVLERAASVTTVSQAKLGGLAFAYANWIILGLARLRARQVDGVVQACAVWDGGEGRPGGTASAVQDWRAFGAAVLSLHPQKEETRALRALSGGALPSGADKDGQRIVSMLFADAVGFSKLEDAQVPLFVTHFLGGVAREVERLREPPLTRNTWGDGLYFSFAHPREAGALALGICEFVRRQDWPALGLPAGLNVRVALHAGPAFEVFDPVIRQRNYTGAHVSRAARIEPVTPPGQVYASQGFAALCECLRIGEFVCEYVGQVPLAKDYGTFPMFHVRGACKPTT